MDSSREQTYHGGKYFRSNNDTEFVRASVVISISMGRLEDDNTPRARMH